MGTPLGSPLQRLPNTAFGIPFGLAAHANLWKSLSVAPWATDYVSPVGNWVLWCISLAAFCLLIMAYSLKACLHPRLVYFEFCHPVRAYFFTIPHLVVTVLATSIPAAIAGGEAAKVWRRAVWVPCCLFQLTLAWTFMVTLTCCDLR